MRVLSPELGAGIAVGTRFRVSASEFRMMLLTTICCISAMHWLDAGGRVDPEEEVQEENGRC